MIVTDDPWDQDVDEWQKAEGLLRRTPGFVGICRVCHTPVLEAHQPIYVWVGLPIGEPEEAIHGTFTCQDEPRCIASETGRQCLLPNPHTMVGAEHLFGRPRAYQ